MRILGLRTAIYPVPSTAQGKAWYSTVLGQEPYFDEPFYVGYNVGGFELGLDPSAAPTAPDSGSVCTYWGVPDAEAGYARLLALGATPHEGVMEVGGGIKVATVRDPFGNIFGIIENPLFQLTEVEQE